MKKLRPIRSCSKWGLPGTKSPAFLGVSYTSVPSLPVRALNAPSAVHFCGTILQLALTGRYPAPCPAEPGLSSRGLTPPAIVCQTFEGNTCIVYIHCKALTREIKWKIPYYINWNGSVFTAEICTSVEYFPAFSCSLSQAATRGFIIFSALWPGSIRAIPAISASWAVW